MNAPLLDMLQKPTAVQWANSDIAALHFDLDWTSFHHASYTTTVTSRAGSGDLLSSLPGPEKSGILIPPVVPVWHPAPLVDTTGTPVGGSVTIIDKAEIRYVYYLRNGANIDTFGSASLPSPITETDIIDFNNPDDVARLRAIVAEVGSRAANSFPATAAGSDYQILSVLASHVEGSGAISTHIVAHSLVLFNLSRIKAAAPKNPVLAVNVVMQGVDPEEQIIFALNVSTWKRVKKLGTDSQLNPEFTGTFTHDATVSFTSLEGSITAIVASFTINLKTLAVQAVRSPSFLDLATS